MTPGFHSWLAPLQALALVTSPRLRLRQSSFSTQFLIFVNHKTHKTHMEGLIFTLNMFVVPVALTTYIQLVLQTKFCKILVIKNMTIVCYIHFAYISYPL